MSKSTDYTAEEWKVISSAPMLAGLLVTVADLSGPIGLVKEAVAVVKGVTETATSTSNELIRTVAETIKAGGGRPDTSELHTDPASSRAKLIERCKQAAALVAQKSPAEAENIRPGRFTRAKGRRGIQGRWLSGYRWHGDERRRKLCTP